MQKIIIAFSVGLVLGAVACGAIIYRASALRIGQLGGQLEQAIGDNRQLGEQLADAEVLVSQLGEELDRSAGFISTAKSELESSKSSVAKIRSILEALRDLERSSGRFDGHSPAP
jgi:hypothetical protein